MWFRSPPGLPASETWIRGGQLETEMGAAQKRAIPDYSRLAEWIGFSGDFSLDVSLGRVGGSWARRPPFPPGRCEGPVVMGVGLAERQPLAQ